MSNRIRELRKELKRLNGLQWTKKRNLRRVINYQAKLQNTVEDIKTFYRLSRSISEITKDMNQRRYQIRIKDSEIQMIKVSVSKAAYFKNDDGSILGVHAHGMMHEGQFIQEDIWANNYYLEDGKYRFRGGSMRVHGPFDVVVQDLIQDGAEKVDIKEDQFHE